MSELHPLKDNQRKAVDPAETVWLSASAGTGKTQVLSARVLRLLLQDGVTPSQILCLTFTKAGAAEMATRVSEVLANWVRMPETKLAEDLAAIGAPTGPEIRARARTLFAAVLDCPGGLRIDTIHAFAQWLLAAFPQEAGLSPGTRAMEDRDRALLSREVLSGLLLDAEAVGDSEMLEALASLSLRMKSAADVESYLLRCAAARDAWFEPGVWQQGKLRGPVNRLLGLAEDASEADLAALCSDDAFDVDGLKLCHSAYNQWNGVKGQAGRVVIADWLAADCEGRLEQFDALFKVLFTQKDTIKDQKSLEKLESHFGEAAQSVLDDALHLRSQRSLILLADFLTPALTLGRAFALAWEAAKAREGLIDFDDQIRAAAELLNRSEISEWIRYKLDRRFDHILIDEAQDTNAAQWEIIKALTGDFFAGAGQHDDMLRTLFVVGDYKQAIFRFQGTSPENFERARDRVEREMMGAADNAAAQLDRRNARSLQKLGLGQSFRTAAEILSFVDRAIAHIGHDKFGLKEAPAAHQGQPLPGLVTLWQPVGMVSDDSGDDDADADSAGEDDAEDSWLSRPDRELADRIARQVAQWFDPHGSGFPLIKGTHRRAGPGDVMILVRRRKELAGLIVARLHAAGVPVAGVDRLRLGAPLAVKDLVAALRFAVQPLDDLSLAALLVSPLIGWSQEHLLEHGYRPKNQHLWAHLRSSRDPVATAAVAQLISLLNKADFGPPQALLHWLLVGPWQGRNRLVARLGREANDPIDELLNAAHAYAMSDTPSITGFLHWFDAGAGELKREAEGAGGLVRVMTVHGAKGLESAIVILADAADNPDRSMPVALELSDPRGETTGGVFHAPKLPLPSLRIEEKLGPVLLAETKAKAEEREEHWRLLYVAMTRAEEALFITGSLGPKDGGKPADDSWYARLAEVLDAEDLDCASIKDAIWDQRREYGSQPDLPPRRAVALELELPPPRPAWLDSPVAAEPRPPRPLAPSSLGEDDAPDPPYAPGAGADAARRGTLIHKLLERLPELAAQDREAASLRWLARAAGDLSEASRADMAASAIAVLGQGDWAELFSAQALAEVPIAALVGDQVVAGTIDRLLITPDHIRLVDFKTARRPPASLAQVSSSILRQMAAYVAALEVTYPGRPVRAALLYTQVPALIEIPAGVIAAHKPALSTGE